MKQSAKKSTFLASAAHYDLLHLSTHGGTGDSIHDTPWIAFSDSILYLPELYTLKTPAKMAVLSACKTSDGKLQQGEGVMSLARGFSYVGVPSVTATLWSVPEATTKEIMQLYYKGLKEGLAKDIALQQAKLTYLQDKKEEPEVVPYYWAASIHIGDSRPIKGAFPWFFGWGLALFALLGGGFLTLIFLKNR